MLFLGTLSVLQLTLFPGLLLIRLFPGKRTFIHQWAYVFMLSLLANYVAIFLLTAVGLYTRAVYMVLFAVEIAALIWVYRGKLGSPIGNLRGRLKQWLADGLRDFNAWLDRDALAATLYFIFGLAAVLALLWLGVFFVDNLDTVWQTYDAWASWDRWAEKWADNRFPGDTWEYPQLIPASYSLTYKFIGTIAVKFFAKSFMPLFSLMIVLMLFDLGRERRSYGYMLAAAFSLFTLYYFLGEYIGDGYVDIPAACFSLMAIYTLFKARRIEDPDELKRILLVGSLATATAGVTKQTGLYILAAYPLLAYFWVLRGRAEFSTRKALVMLGRHLALVLLIVLPWYAFAQYRILYGGNTSNIQYVISDIYEGQSLPDRFVAAVASLGNYAYLYVFLLLSLPVFNSRFRHVVLFIIFPYSILWAFFLSYEYRNLAVAFPLIAMAAGVGLESWLSRLSLRRSSQTTRLPGLTPIALLVLALAVATLVLDAGTLVEHQLTQQRFIFNSSLNSAMYDYFNGADGPEPVITDYTIGWLPGLEDTWVLERFRDYNQYQDTLKAYPDVELLLIPLQVRDPRILEEVEQSIVDGRYERIFVESGYMLVRIPPRK